MSKVPEASRYGDAKPTDLDGEYSVEEIPKLVQELRAVYDSEHTYSITWRKKQLKQFIRMIDECEEELCEAMFADLHKSYFEGYATELKLVRGEAVVALKKLDTWIKPKKKSTNLLNFPAKSYTRRDPLGVVLVLGAWNYPMQLSMSPMVGAIAGGNTVIMKPGSYAVNSSHAMARVIHRYLDPQAIKVVEGNREITNALLKEKFDMIFFTGSGFVGRLVAKAAAEHLTPCVLELGGKSPCIVDKSANLDHAVRRFAFASLLNSGQTCVRPDFLLVHEKIGDQFVQKLQDTIRKHFGENPKESVWYGRLINDAAFQRLSKLVEEEVEHGRVVFGGEMDPATRYICPTIVDYGSDFESFKASKIMEDEIFGPVIPVVRYSNLESVVNFIKHLPTGKPLGLYCFSRDKQFIDVIKTRTTSGGLNINDAMMHLVNHSLPFGGVGASGMGNYHGEYGFNTFTHERACLEKSQGVDQCFPLRGLLANRFPPYSQSKLSVLRLLGAVSGQASKISKSQDLHAKFHEKDEQQPVPHQK